MSEKSDSFSFCLLRVTIAIHAVRQSILFVSLSFYFISFCFVSIYYCYFSQYVIIFLFKSCINGVKIVNNIFCSTIWLIFIQLLVRSFACLLVCYALWCFDAFCRVVYSVSLHSIMKTKYITKKMFMEALHTSFLLSPILYQQSRPNCIYFTRFLADVR